MYNTERGINAQLTVVPMQGWQRGDWYDSTGLLWINPSPNLRTIAQAALYPGVGMIEMTNVSVGRGTDTPFEVVGAPWVDGKVLSAYLNARLIGGVRFTPVKFRPTSSKYADEICGGIHIEVIDRNVIDAPQMGIELAAALRHLYRDQYKTDKMNTLMLNSKSFDAFKAGSDPLAISQSWVDGLEEFKTVRAKYLLY
jgi:uncharacterized protein YbbC (DUF1343 family)